MDAKVPRAERDDWPLVVCGDEVVAVPGVAEAPGWEGVVTWRAVKDAVGEILIEEEPLQARIAELGAEISREYEGRDLLLVGVLKGAVFFMADLMRELTIPCEIDFMAISSYGAAHRLLGRRADPQGPRRRTSPAATCSSSRTSSTRA